MKKILLIFFILFMTGANLAISQNSSHGFHGKPYPIPSFGVIVNGTEAFAEQFNPVFGTNTDGKRNMNVKVSTISGSHKGASSVEATVWLRSIQGSDLLGPYTVVPEETLTVPIDDKEWGAIVESASEILVDVWIDE